MIIRWLGAFRKSNSNGLLDSLVWETSQNDRTALAAERLVKGKSRIHGSKIGLLVKNRSLLRKFSGDVWSEYDPDTGKLIKTRHEHSAYSSHTECFVRPDYCGIVVKRGARERATETARAFAQSHGLPLLRLTRDGRLVSF
jgi:hypothetical protein